MNDASGKIDRATVEQVMAKLGGTFELTGEAQARNQVPGMGKVKYFCPKRWRGDQVLGLLVQEDRFGTGHYAKLELADLLRDATTQL